MYLTQTWCKHTKEDTCISYEFCVFVYLYHISDIVRKSNRQKRKKEGRIKGRSEREREKEEKQAV